MGLIFCGWFKALVVIGTLCPKNHQISSLIHQKKANIYSFYCILFINPPRSIVSGRIIHGFFNSSIISPRNWWGTSIRNYLWMGSLGCVTGFLVRSFTGGCPVRRSGWINGDRINGLVHLLINGVYWSYNPVTNHFSIFLGHPSMAGQPTPHPQRTPQEIRV